VNCATIQTGSYTLFGEEKNPDSRDIGIELGRLELAQGGTVYVDGLSRLPARTQTQLAEVLDRVGSDSGVDLRVIASNTTSLDDDLGQSRIEPQLHRKLAAHQVRVPSLAERKEDIPAIAEYFAQQHARVVGKPIDGISEASIERLQAYRWPGNIKELRSVLERAVVMCESPMLEVDESLLEEGVSIGSYRLVEKLGAGGMGEVWLAKHQMLARPAAVKLIRQEASNQVRDDTLLQRFRREAQATARLRSPHTVELYDFGVSETGSFYYVMECLDGIDLDGMVHRFGTLPPERVVYLLQHACRSLAEAHEAGLVPRISSSVNWESITTS
jgi:DNA-binding NtrC family response regulator